MFWLGSLCIYTKIYIYKYILLSGVFVLWVIFVNELLVGLVWVKDFFLFCFLLIGFFNCVFFGFKLN